MRRALAVVLTVAALAACSSAKQQDLPAPVIASAATTGPAALPPSPSSSQPIPIAQGHRIRQALLDLATAQETAFVDTAAYVAFQGAVPKALTAAGFPGVTDVDFVLGASLPTKDTYCLIAVYRPNDAFELYHSEGTPGLAGSAKDIPDDCNPLVLAVVARAQKTASAAG